MKPRKQAENTPFLQLKAESLLTRSPKYQLPYRQCAGSREGRLNVKFASSVRLKTGHWIARLGRWILAVGFWGRPFVARGGVIRNWRFPEMIFHRSQARRRLLLGIRHNKDRARPDCEHKQAGVRQKRFQEQREANIESMLDANG